MLRIQEGKEPDCGACLPPLMAENVDIIRVYMAVQGQVRVAVDGTVIDLDHNAVWKYIEKCGVENEFEVFEQVIGLFRHFLEESREGKVTPEEYLKERDKVL